MLWGGMYDFSHSVFRESLKYIKLKTKCFTRKLWYRKWDIVETRHIFEISKTMNNFAFDNQKRVTNHDSFGYLLHRHKHVKASWSNDVGWTSGFSEVFFVCVYAPRRFIVRLGFCSVLLSVFLLCLGRTLLLVGDGLLLMIRRMIDDCSQALVLPSFHRSLKTTNSNTFQCNSYCTKLVVQRQC